MAKDPAFLFYPGDWQGGTMTMSRHIKGCYIDLLIAQFNSGPLSLEEIKIVLGNDFAAWQGSLSKKFKKNSEGLFFNERLEAEKAKRADYSIKQTERIKKRWNKSGSSSGNTVVLPIKNENRNEDDLKGEERVQGEKPAADDLFADYQHWTEQIVSKSDQFFEQMLMKEHLSPNGQLEFIARDHLGMLARYPKQRPPDAHKFRLSLLKHIREHLKKETHGNPAGKKQQHTANIAASVTETYRDVIAGG